MAYNLFERSIRLHNVFGAANDTQIQLTQNPGPDIWLYVHAAVYHDDVADRSVGIYILRGSRIILVSESKVIPGDLAGVGFGTGISLNRPAIVIPGDQLRAKISALSTGSSMREFSALYLEIPAGQSLSGDIS